MHSKTETLPNCQPACVLSAALYILVSSVNTGFSLNWQTGWWPVCMRCTVGLLWGFLAKQMTSNCYNYLPVLLFLYHRAPRHHQHLQWQNKSGKNIWLFSCEAKRTWSHVASQSMKKWCISGLFSNVWTLTVWLIRLQPPTEGKKRRQLFFFVISSFLLPFSLLTYGFVCLLNKDRLISTPRRHDKPSNLPPSSLHFSLLCLKFIKIHAI